MVDLFTGTVAKLAAQLARRLPDAEQVDELLRQLEEESQEQET
jgi:hypothetical protein